MKRIALQSNGDASLHNQVEQFHKAFDIANRETPGVPSDETVRYRLRLIAEEFFELLAACGIGDLAGDDQTLQEGVSDAIRCYDLRVDLPEFADACGDLDYVVEGARQAFGIDGAPIADAIHTANLAKLHDDGKVVKNDFGKVIKPEGWTPPDIAGELREQGWDGK
jgi:predicted HAD superfamily Cof-like phosphohydrolase